MNFLHKGLTGDDTLFQYVSELTSPKVTEIELYAAISWDIYGLPDGTTNPTHLTRTHMLMRPRDQEINAAFNKVISKMIPWDKKWLIQIPRRIANLNAFDARVYLSPKGGAAIVLPLGAFGGLFRLNELFHSLIEPGELPKDLRGFVSARLPEILAHWLLCEEAEKLGLHDDQVISLSAFLEEKRWIYGRDDRVFIWATTVVQQLFLLLHEFGHLVNTDFTVLQKSISWVRPYSFQGSDKELQADGWALSYMSKGIEGICDAQSEHIEQSLFLLMGVLHFLRQNGYFSEVDSDLYAQRWLQIAQAVNPEIGGNYTINMSRQLLSVFKDFYLGNKK